MRRSTPSVQTTHEQGPLPAPYGVGRGPFLLRYPDPPHPASQGPFWTQLAGSHVGACGGVEVLGIYLHRWGYKSPVAACWGPLAGGPYLPSYKKAPPCSLYLVQGGGFGGLLILFSITCPAPSWEPWCGPSDIPEPCSVHRCGGSCPTPSGCHRKDGRWQRPEGVFWPWYPSCRTQQPVP